MKYIINFDDFSEDNNRLDLLEKLKSEMPNFKATLFTVVGRCSDKFIERVKQYDWLDMCPHGWRHTTIYGDVNDWVLHPTIECKDWTAKDVYEYVGAISRFNLTPVFKSPGWLLSEEAYKKFYELGYWIADLPNNEQKWYKKDKMYIYDSPFKVATHIQNIGTYAETKFGNKGGLEKRFDYLLSLKGNDFIFIKEYLGI